MVKITSSKVPSELENSPTIIFNKKINTEQFNIHAFTLWSHYLGGYNVPNLTKSLRKKKCKIFFGGGGGGDDTATINRRTKNIRQRYCCLRTQE